MQHTKNEKSKVAFSCKKRGCFLEKFSKKNEKVCIFTDYFLLEIDKILLVAIDNL